MSASRTDGRRRRRRDTAKTSVFGFKAVLGVAADGELALSVEGGVFSLHIFTLLQKCARRADPDWERFVTQLECSGDDRVLIVLDSPLVRDERRGKLCWLISTFAASKVS